ncbi:MAG: hypothetical protein ABIS07_02255 [Dokdonella sp.]
MSEESGGGEGHHMAAWDVYSKLFSLHGRRNNGLRAGETLQLPVAPSGR